MKVIGKSLNHPFRLFLSKVQNLGLFALNYYEVSIDYVTFVDFGLVRGFQILGMISKVAGHFSYVYRMFNCSL